MLILLRPRKDADVVTGILANQKAYLENMQKTLTPGEAPLSDLH